MILASIRTDRAGLDIDGELVVVHPNHTMIAIPPASEFTSLARALDNWDVNQRRLHEIDRDLRAGKWKETRSVDSAHFLAPLPRTYSFLDGSAFIQHVILVRKARGAEPPEDLMTVPLMYQGTSDNLLAATDDIPLLDAAYGVDFESELAIVTDDVPCGTKKSAAEKHIKLLLLMNDISLRELIPREMATGFGFLNSKPPSAFAPFALTPDELGSAWHDGRVHLPVVTHLNGELFGKPNAGEMHFSFHDLIEHASRTRPLSVGTIIGSGTISNKDEGAGSSCLVERRMLEKIKDGKIETKYLVPGDRVRIMVQDGERELFGVIDQLVSQA